jgi:hypothetical protein
VERWTNDLNEAVNYALAHRDEKPKSGAIYGGVDGGPSDEADAFIKMFMAAMMDQQMSIPA